MIRSLSSLTCLSADPFDPVRDLIFNPYWIMISQKHCFSKTTQSVSKAVTGCSVNVANTGMYLAADIVQLYLRDPVSSLTRPVNELKAFKKISLKLGESLDVQFELQMNQLDLQCRPPCKQNRPSNSVTETLQTNGCASGSRSLIETVSRAISACLARR